MSAHRVAIQHLLTSIIEQIDPEDVLGVTAGQENDIIDQILEAERHSVESAYQEGYNLGKADMEGSVPGSPNEDAYWAAEQAGYTRARVNIAYGIEPAPETVLEVNHSPLNEPVPYTAAEELTMQMFADDVKKLLSRGHVPDDVFSSFDRIVGKYIPW